MDNKQRELENTARAVDAEKLYDVDASPIYDPNIRELKNTDPANATDVFNPIIQKLVNNIHAVKLAADSASETLINTNPAGIHTELTSHTQSNSNPHGVTAAQIGAVPATRAVNGKALSADVTLSAADVGARGSAWMPTASDVGAVPTSRTINGKALSSDIMLIPSDIGLGNVLNEDWKTASLSLPADTATNGNTDTAAKSGTLPSLFNWLREKVNWILGSNGLGSKVPNSRMVNGKALSANITLTPSDIGAAAPAQTYTATIPTSGWSSSAPYSVSVTVSGITSSMTPIIDIVLSAAASTAKLQLEAWGKVGRITTTTNAITVYCYEEKPTTAIPIQLKAVG